MAVFLGGILGSTLGGLFLTYLIYRFGPKNIKINFALQMIVGVLATYSTTSNIYGIDYRSSDITASYIGLVLALIIMLVIMSKKKIEKKDLK